MVIHLLAAGLLYLRVYSVWQELEGRQLRVNSGPPPARRENSNFRGENSNFRGENTNFRGPRGGANLNSTNRIYVGNLSWGVDDLALETLFSEQGKVTEARVIYDRETGRSRGFGFVTYNSAEEVNRAIESLDGVVSVSSICLIMNLLIMRG